MQASRNIALATLTIVTAVLVGCSSTKVTEREILSTDKLSRPTHIWVYDFVAPAADVPPGSTLSREFSVQTGAQTAEQVAMGRQLGSQIATELVQQISEMGLPVQKASRAAIPQPNDIVIRGYLISIKEGSAARRVTVGFGAGASELRTVVEGYQVTPQGQRKLGSVRLRLAAAKGRELQLVRPPSWPPPIPQA